MGIFDIFTGKHAQRAAEAANRGITQGLQYGQTAFEGGRGEATGQYMQGLQPFQQLFGQAGQGATQYGNALGLGGQEAQQQALGAFQNTPGYQAGLNQGLDAIDRRAASRGMLGSGNTNQDTMRFATDYANQNFNQYMNQLSPYLGQQTTAATGIAGMHGNLGNLLNQNLMGQGAMGFQAHTGIGQNNAGAEMAKGQGGANLLGTLLNVGTKALGMFG